MRAHFGVIRIDLQGSPQLADRLIELPLPRQRQAQFVVRNRVVRPQQHRLPRLRLGLVKGALFEERPRKVPPRRGVLGIELDDAPELNDGIVLTAQRPR